MSETQLKEEIKTLKKELNEAEESNLRFRHECEVRKLSMRGKSAIKR
jgi:hypothetical protein